MQHTIRRRFKRNIIAIVYDFDGTLIPQYMQEYTVFPKIGVKGKKFWGESQKQSEETGGEEIVTYMRLLLEYARRNKYPITRKNLGDLAKNIKFFPGIPKYFERINKYVRTKTNGKIKLRHYIISAGLKEIIEKTAIKGYFHNIFGSEYYYNHSDQAVFPNIIVNDTLKTQFIFRINKGKELLSDSINTYMPISERVIPFQNILYVGDGLTDVPCMAVTRKQGGSAIAVYKSHNHDSISICKQLFEDNRVDFIAPADYSKGSELNTAIKIVLDNIICGIYSDRLIFNQYIKYFERNR